MNPYKPSNPETTTGEIVGPAAIRDLAADPLPHDPLTAGLSGGGLSITGIVNKARTRGELSREALAIFKHAAVESMRQQAAVVLQGRDLTATAMKQSQLEAFLGSNAQLVNRLWGRLEEYVNSMKDGELTTIVAAEEEAVRRLADIETKVSSGAISREAGDRLAALVDEHRLYKAQSALDRCEEFLEELKRQMKATISQLEVDSKRFI